MKRTHLIRMFIALLCLPLCLASARAETPAAPKVGAVPGHSSPFISTFNDSRGYGKDPFFPKSRRREITPVVNTNIVMQPGELPAGLVLKGLSGTKEKPLAIINNYTFAAGEEAEVRVGNQLFRIKCVEIKERAAVVSINGTPPRELALRQGL